MQTFLQFLESQNQIRFISRNKYGDIKFAVGNEIHKFIIDGAVLYSKAYERELKNNIQAAYNYAKKNDVTPKL